jgi:hypothetical protein
MKPSKLFVVEARGSRAPEIVDGDLLVVDSSWRTKFIDASATTPSGNYLIPWSSSRLMHRVERKLSALARKVLLFTVE